MATRGLGLFLFVLQLFVLLSNPATPSTRPSSTPLPPDALCRSIGRSASFLGTGALRLVGGNELELSDVSEEERRRYASSFFNERSGGSRDWNERGRPRRGAPRRYDDSDGWGEKRRDERTDAWGARESGRGGWQSRGQAFRSDRPPRLHQPETTHKKSLAYFATVNSVSGDVEETDSSSAAEGGEDGKTDGGRVDLSREGGGGGAEQVTRNSNQWGGRRRREVCQVGSCACGQRLALLTLSH
eukprot:1255030-Rhodomonas_salina.2